ncbi:MAG TPA: hypothetical protein VFB38_17335 [Chthonomonadaceae bacterium]|nr:hypothetical protein [Chthonomonadaceae bacterium]HZT42196.1 hypothetical protein [Chthonomonadaceae bacterium]
MNIWNIAGSLLLSTGLTMWAQPRNLESATPSVRVACVSPVTPQPHRPGNAVIFYDDFDRPPDQEPRYFEYNFSAPQNRGGGSASKRTSG